MTRKYSILAVVGTLLLLILPMGEALAYDPGPREGKWDFTVQMRYMDGMNLNGTGDTSVDINSTLGWGFGIGYNLTNKLALAMDINWANANYNATYINNLGAPGTYYGTMYASTIALNLTYYLTDGAIAPFVMGGIGSSFIDTNIPTGPSTGQCWYDPWWGYVCNSYQPTYSSSNFSYNAGLGLRWDLAPGFFLRGIFQEQWIDTSKATIEVPAVRLDIGFSFR
jgi:opacity protein-like surface antigen